MIILYRGIEGVSRIKFYIDFIEGVMILSELTLNIKINTVYDFECLYNAIL